MDKPTAKKLSTGYYHVRWNHDQWIQWPMDRTPTLADGFGWLGPGHVLEAIEAVMGLA